MKVDLNSDDVQEILSRTEKGEALSVICADEFLPGRRTVYDWIDADPEFAAQFRAARARGVHFMAEDCLRIADEPVKDAVEVANKRVRIDTRLRLAGKWLAAEYGDKIDVQHHGEVTHRHDLSSYTADELDALEKLVAKSADAGRDQSGESPTPSGSVH